MKAMASCAGNFFHLYFIHIFKEFGLKFKRVAIILLVYFFFLMRLFEVLCIKKKGNKIDLLGRYLSRFSLECDLFPLLRLFVPQIDPFRPAYNIKEHTLAKIYSDALALPKREKERLLGYKDAHLQMNHKCIPGDFSSVLYSVLQARESAEEEVLSVQKVQFGYKFTYN